VAHVASGVENWAMPLAAHWQPTSLTQTCWLAHKPGRKRLIFQSIVLAHSASSLPTQCRATTFFVYPQRRPPRSPLAPPPPQTVLYCCLLIWCVSLPPRFDRSIASSIPCCRLLWSMPSPRPFYATATNYCLSPLVLVGNDEELP
jgi:hypothetical protein